jgi:hypothetical protein
MVRKILVEKIGVRKKSPSPKAGWGRKRQKKSLALFGRVFPELPVVRHAKLAKIPDRFLKSWKNKFFLKKILEIFGGLRGKP